MHCPMLLLFTLAIVAGSGASARDYVVKTLNIEHPFARATPPGAHTGVAYLVIANKGADADRLVRAASPVAGAVEFHEMRMDNGVMRMRAVARVDIKPGQRVAFEPGRLHLMLLDLKQPLKDGDQFPLTLTFDKAGTVEVSVAVEQPIGPGGPMPKR